MTSFDKVCAGKYRRHWFAGSPTCRRCGAPAKPVRVKQVRRVSPHGTRACYARGCRRVECSRANKLYSRRWNRDRVLGLR